MGTILSNFYENKYSEEKYTRSIPIIPYKEYPTNRNEACVKYFANNFKGGKILELGSGNGIIANSLLSLNINITKYVATDLSNNRLEAIKNNINNDKLEVMQVDVENFDFNELEKFDAIIMVALIEHLVDPLNSMINIKKVLKQDGFVYIDTPNIADYGARFKLLRGVFPSTASKKEGLLSYYNKPVTLLDEGHLHYFTYKSLSRMLTEYAKFDKIDKYYYPVGRLIFGKRIHYFLAKMYPELFSMLIVAAYNKTNN